MEVDGIPQAYIISGYSCSHAVEKPQQKEPPAKHNSSDETALKPSMDGCFDCSICLDSAVDPVVTLCGHLYCWPCIYKWMQLEGMSHQQCPVCKALLSEDTLVPLYGHGGRSAKVDSDVPCRPTFHRNHATIASGLDRHSLRVGEARYSNLYQPMQQAQSPYHYYHQHNRSIADSPPLITPLLRSTTGAVLSDLAIGILSWVYRTHGSSMYHANPYRLTLSGNNPRLRRQQLQVESLLHQIWLFLLCCAVLCLLLF